jgi:PAS domain S-box-containing protein
VKATGAAGMFNDLLKGKKISGNLPFKSIYGKKSLLSFSCSPIFDGVKFMGAVLIVTDITERKQAEGALRESEERFQQIAENAQEWIWEVDADGLYTYASPIVKKILGYKPEEIVGKKHFYDLFHPEDREELKKAAFEVLAQKQSFREFLNRNVHKNSKTVWLSTSGVPILDEKGNLLGYRGADTDVTERKQTEAEIKKFKTIIDHANYGVAIADLNGNLIYVNEHFAGVHGYKPAELIGKNLAIFHNKTQLKEVMKINKKLQERGSYSALEVWHAHKDGSVFPMLMNGVVIKNEEGTPLFMAATAIDITEHKQADEALRESEERYRDLFENANDLIQSVYPSGKFAYVNQKWLEVLGYTKDEVGKLTLWDILRKDQIPHCMEVFKTVSRGEEVTGVETVFVSKNGKEIYVEGNANARLKDGKFVATRGIFRDITDRKKAEEKLYESEEKFRNLAEQSPNMIFINKKGRVVYANKRCEEAMGYKKEEFYSPDFDFFTLIAPESIDIVKTALSNHTRGKEVAPYEYTLITKEGKKIEAIHTTKLIQYDGERAILGIITDITERKKIENRIKMERQVYQSIARAANQSRSVEKLCELALEGIQRIIKYDMADVLVYRESENALVSAAQFGYPKDLYLRTIKRRDLKEESGVAAQAVRKRKSIYIDDVKTSKLTRYVHDLIVKYNISTLYVVPLFSRGKLQGVLEVLTLGDKKLSREDHEVLDTISEELAGGIAKAKIEERLVTAKEAFGWLTQG